MDRLRKIGGIVGILAMCALLLSCSMGVETYAKETCRDQAVLDFLSLILGTDVNHGQCVSFVAKGHGQTEYGTNRNQDKIQICRDYPDLVAE